MRASSYSFAFGGSVGNFRHCGGKVFLNSSIA